MYKFILRRLSLIPLVILGVTFMLFALFQILSPEMRASLYVKDPRQLDSLNQVIKQHSLDKNVFVQYGSWLKNVAKGELGYSQSAAMPVATAIKSYLPATVELAVLTIIPVLLFGVSLGIISARWQDKWPDNAVRLFSVGSYSLPIFVLGLIFLMVFYAKLRMFAPGRCSIATDYLIIAQHFKTYTGLLTVDAVLNGNFYVFADALKHLILPASALCLGSMALLIRVTRSSMLEELGKDYIRTARAKGASEFSVLVKHGARNALIPVITLASLQFVRLLGGVVIIETVFDFPGIGRWGVNAAQQLDIAGVLGFAVVTATLFVAGNLISDILYAAADPRIRVHE